MTEKSDLKKRIRDLQAETGGTYTAARAQVLRARESGADQGRLGDNENEAGKEPVIEQVTAVVLACNVKSIRVRVQGEEQAFTLRCGSYEARDAAPAQLIEASLTKRWQWNGHSYASGSVDRAWTDVGALGLVPLPLVAQGPMDLNATYDGYEPPDPYAAMWDFFASTTRTAYEFDGIAWGAGVGVDDDPDTCRVSDAAEVGERDPAAARQMLVKILLDDPRCIDAHAHLGNLSFDRFPDHALTHYEIAVRIGDLSLGAKFTDMLPWHCLYNRPYLRSLHGYGLCLWRADRLPEAQRVFERLLSFNPADNQGARFSWDDVRNGRPWQEA